MTYDNFKCELTNKVVYKPDYGEYILSPFVISELEKSSECRVLFEEAYQEYLNSKSTCTFHEYINESLLPDVLPRNARCLVDAVALENYNISEFNKTTPTCLRRRKLLLWPLPDWCVLFKVSTKCGGEERVITNPFSGFERVDGTQGHTILDDIEAYKQSILISQKSN